MDTSSLMVQNHHGTGRHNFFVPFYSLALLSSHCSNFLCLSKVTPALHSSDEICPFLTLLISFTPHTSCATTLNDPFMVSPSASTSSVSLPLLFFHFSLVHLFILYSIPLLSHCLSLPIYHRFTSFHSFYVLLSF